MNKEREEICRKCKMLPSIHHLEYPCCGQPMYPLDEHEWELLGADPEDEITVESLRKMMEISLQPYCMEKMLQAHPIEWWYKKSTT
jgi:hypothetical protein